MMIEEKGVTTEGQDLSIRCIQHPSGVIDVTMTQISGVIRGTTRLSTSREGLMRALKDSLSKSLEREEYEFCGLAHKVIKRIEDENKFGVCK
jgi:hypothetical protein